jgi:hypothetical protein
METPPIDLMLYRSLLALWACAFVLAVSPGNVGISRMRASGWLALAFGLGLGVLFFLQDERLDRFRVREYGLAAVLALFGVVLLIETGGFSLRKAWQALPALRARGLADMGGGAVRVLAALMLVPAGAHVLPWWMGLDPDERSITAFLGLYCLAAGGSVVGSLLEAGIRRGLQPVEAANRPAGIVLLYAAPLPWIALAFAIVRPEQAAGWQIAWVALVACGAYAGWHAALRWGRRRMGLPPMEVPERRVRRRRRWVGRQRRDYRPEFRMRVRRGEVVIRGEVGSAPRSQLVVRSSPLRVWVEVLEPDNPYAPYVGWTGVAVLERPIDPSTTRAVLRHRWVTIRARLVPA